MFRVGGMTLPLVLRLRRQLLPAEHVVLSATYEQVLQIQECSKGRRTSGWATNSRRRQRFRLAILLGTKGS